MMNSNHEHLEKFLIPLDGLPKILLIAGCLLFLFQNIFFYIFLYYLPIDVLGAFLFTTTLFYMFIHRKLGILLITGIFMIGWGICTLAWRFLIFQNSEILDNDLYGQLNIIILFGISAVLLFISLFMLFRIITYSLQFHIFSKKKRLSAFYVRIFILYLLLHLSSSMGIIVGGMNSNLINMLNLGLFFKLFIVPIFGIIVFSVTIYLLSEKDLKIAS
ncbi:MAG: hypothetical protein ACXADY_24335 [Candidatus Hodarchaeales archaeon]